MGGKGGAGMVPLGICPASWTLNPIERYLDRNTGQLTSCADTDAYCKTGADCGEVCA